MTLFRLVGYNARNPSRHGPLAMARERLPHLGGMYGEVSCTRECLKQYAAG